MELTNGIKEKDNPERIPPKRIILLEPHLSTAQPTMGPAIPPCVLLKEAAIEVMARVHPNSAIIGLKKTPKL